MNSYRNWKKTILFLTIFHLSLSAPVLLQAEEQITLAQQVEWDSALSSLLLAAGMYGFDTNEPAGLSIGMEEDTELLHTLEGGGALNNQSITFSYSGSSGRLDFSAGYIFTAEQSPEFGEPATILLDLDNSGYKTFDGTTPWFIALDFSKSFQLNENFSLGIGSRAMLMKNPFGDQNSRIYSFLLDLPLTYRDVFTITPQLQWSRPVGDGTVTEQYQQLPSAHPDKDSFFGGMSISFSY